MQLKACLLLAVVAVVLPVLAPSSPLATAHADSAFRCESGRLVSSGDHMLEVKKKCGEPDFVVQKTEKRRVKAKVRRWVDGVAQEISEEREVEVLVDEWTYDLGPDRFIRHVYFQDGRVTEVRTGSSYGTKR